jgi:hypothetical protein
MFLNPTGIGLSGTNQKGTTKASTKVVTVVHPLNVLGGSLKPCERERDQLFGSGRYPPGLDSHPSAK